MRRRTHNGRRFQAAPPDGARHLRGRCLVDELKKAKEELFNLRFQSATGQLDAHGRIRVVKRDIARIYTVIRERELGLRATPAAIEAPAKKSAAKKKAATETVETADEKAE